VSNERDGAEAADGNESGEPRGRTAVVTRPQRPTGKRSRRRVDTEDDTGDAGASAGLDLAEDGSEVEVTKTAKPAKPKKSSISRGPNPIAYVYNYLQQVVAELRKVIWPNRKQMITYTTVVLVFLMFMVALVGVADLGLAKLVILVFGGR
jgi:preprotein translocase subunit SecE